MPVLFSLFLDDACSDSAFFLDEDTNQLTGTIPTELGLVTELRELDLREW